jgi:hypothetical protein
MMKASRAAACDLMPRLGAGEGVRCIAIRTNRRRIGAVTGRARALAMPDAPEVMPAAGSKRSDPRLTATLGLRAGLPRLVRLEG